MVATAKRIGAEGFDVMPHFPARIIKDKATLTKLGRGLQGGRRPAKASSSPVASAQPVGDYRHLDATP
jgi:methylenetetrahydrofolate reductase (NADPH)